MAKQVSVSEARENLKDCVNEVHPDQVKPSLLEAKKKLLSLDEKMDLPPLVPHIDRGRWKEALVVSLVWSASEEGIKTLTPLIKKYMTFKVF